ncbi:MULTISPECIES: TraR/DksA family transcriptional regulator [Marinobacter]|jgi:RNA polymerase-binding transcription factor DksA|uniref:TraR/DksA family transcriptional regulator n=1 Tax=Marinobacter nauticus TaxID=2743 RepID=A0A368VAE8_MARNT|nr:TraR/DksA C4-type zinc finger protein [Marinobacter nauticus]RBP77293.1 TraR/DksA family transcriptional regulator [Marinobacter nauticus]RCW38139.1 TraR/DksA family transcriptional regulator [Marinobacter nauticus]
MANRKSELETLKADLEARLSRYQAHQRREAGALEKDFEEQASQTQNDEVVDSLEAETRAELQQIDHALERIDQGIGDECEQCGNDIDPRRLQVLPYTTVCVDCAAD